MSIHLFRRVYKANKTIENTNVSVTIKTIHQAKSKIKTKFKKIEICENKIPSPNKNKCEREILTNMWHRKIGSENFKPN